MLHPELERLAHQPNFATLTTLSPRGVPQSSIMWVDCDDDCLLINTEVGRAKYRNISHNPMVTVLIWDRTNPYHYAEVRGRVVRTVSGDAANTQLQELAFKYTGGAFGGTIESPRVILEIAPEHTRVVD